MAPSVQKGEHRVLNSAGLSYMQEMATCRSASIACLLSVAETTTA